MMIRIAAGAVLILLPDVARGQDTVPVDDSSTGTTIELTTSNCNCTGCPNSDRVAVGLQKDLVSPACPEGSVATVTTLRTADTKGALSKYDLLTWNEGAISGDLSINPPYIYRQASEIDQETKCYEADPSVLPVIGDQNTIKVSLNCEAVICDFQWDVQFGCAELGVLTTSIDGGLQVLSDVDDTIACASPSTCDSIPSCVSHSLAGIDSRLEHKEMYPGVGELMNGLALGPNDGNDGQYVPAKPMLLSARPREAQLILAIDQDSELNVYVESVGDRVNHINWGVNTDSSMYGTIRDGTSFTKFGGTKAESFNSVSSERPNTRFAFLGDNGQGDVCGAQSMLESTNGDRLEVVFIHVVQDPENALIACEHPDGGDFTLDLPESDTVHYHRTHAEAAIWAFDRGLISCCSAHNVYLAINEWVECRCDGICPEAGLNTGFVNLATRNETLAYCEELRNDQKVLLGVVDECDPGGDCPNHAEVKTSSAMRAVWAGRSRYAFAVGSLVLGFFSSHVG